MSEQTNPRNISKPESGRRGRDAVFVREGREAPYRLHGSYPDQTHCTSCGVAFEGGKWAWPHQLTSGKPLVKEIVCPACRRVQDGYPAGWLTLSGPYLAAHESTILDLVRVEQQLEQEEHPMNRIMAIERTDEGTVITTTDVHLPRRLANAIHRAYSGQVTGGYTLGDEEVRLAWHREDVPTPVEAPRPEAIATEVKANGLIVTPEADAYLANRIERLRYFYPRLMAVRVSLDAPEGHHRKGGPYSVNIHVELPGADAHVTRQSARDLHVAIRNAFNAAQRQLEDTIRRQRGDVSPTVRPLRGKVLRTYPERGYGFLQSEDGHEVYFKDSSVLAGKFELLQEGAVVHYHEEMGDEGPQASSVDAG